MSIKINNQNIVALYKGGQSIAYVYKGTDLVWQLINDLDDDIFFADPEVGRVLHANGLIADPVKSSKRELATITSLNPTKTFNGSYFYANKNITQFPELKYCTGLTDLTWTFYYCTSLTTADIPSSVTSLLRTFIGCSSLTTAPVIPSSVTDLTATFASCSNLTTAPAIPSSVTSLGATFHSCTNLTKAPVIPEGVTNMDSAFYECSSLLEAPVLPEGVTSLSQTFYYCTSLTKAPVIPSSVTDISSVFSGCRSIDGIYIINIVTPISPLSNSVMNSLYNVQAIYVPNESVNIYKTHEEWSYFADRIYPISSKP